MTVKQQKVEMVFQDESGIGMCNPFVTVFIDNVQHDKVWAYISREQGADGGWYPVIRFRRDNPGLVMAAIGD